MARGDGRVASDSSPSFVRAAAPRVLAAVRAAQAESMESVPGATVGVELSERAAKAMKTALRKARGSGVRISVEGKGERTAFRLRIEDAPGPSDIVVDRNGVPLYLAPYQLEQISDLRIDYIRDAGHEGFVVQQLQGCGCGPSCGCGS